MNNEPIFRLERLLSPRVWALLFLLFVMPVSADETTEDGFAAWSRGDYQTATRIWHITGQAGDPLAQYNLGWAYLSGLGVEKNNETSLLWFTKAADNDDEIAQQKLLEILIQKPGDVVTYEQIDKWLTKISQNPSDSFVEQLHGQAINEEPVAQLILGVLYEDGIAVGRDEVQAMQNYLGAAKHGVAVAQTFLASLFEHAEEISRDYDEAIVWYLKAAEQGYTEAQYRLALLYESGGLLARNPTEALRWFKSAESQGERRARVPIGRLLYEKQDYVGALSWFKIAEKDGDIWSRYHIATMHYLGYGVPTDAGTAFRWLRQMVKADMNMIAKMEEASSTGQLVAQVGLGYIFSKGEDYLRDLDKAFDYFLLAAIQGDSYAQRHIGDFYFKGISVGEDLSEAEEWYRKAAEQGDQDATNGLVKIQHLRRLRLEEVKVLLSKAKRAFKDGKLTKPVSSSALTYYKKALELDENNQQALEGIRAIIDYFIRIIEDAIVDKKLDVAEEALTIVISVEPQNDIARELKKQLLVAQEEVQSSTTTIAAGVESGQECKEPSADLTGITELSSGTAFIINRQGYAVTNGHVISYDLGEKAYECDALQTYYKGEKRWAVLVQADPKNDLAIIRTCRNFPITAQLRGDKVELEEGEEVAAYGYPLAQDFRKKARITNGIVSALSGFGNDSTRLQHTASIQPGNSGGPLLDLHGKIVGVNVSSYDSVHALKTGEFVPQNVNFAIKSRLVRDFLRSNHIRHKVAEVDDGEELSFIEVKRIADKFTVMVICWGIFED